VRVHAYLPTITISDISTIIDSVCSSFFYCCVSEGAMVPPSRRWWPHTAVCRRQYSTCHACVPAAAAVSGLAQNKVHAVGRQGPRDVDRCSTVCCTTSWCCYIDWVLSASQAPCASCTARRSMAHSSCANSNISCRTGVTPGAPKCSGQGQAAGTGLPSRSALPTFKWNRN
jgi:hypothetical protein